MKERPILFSGPMVRAILEGWKTQTRRVVKAEHLRGSMEPGQVLNERTTNDAPRWCPYVQPGDRLWVRETWAYNGQAYKNYGPEERRREGYVTYAADGAKVTHYFPEGPMLPSPPQTLPARMETEDEVSFENRKNDYYINYFRRFRPSIHMPRWASRITLEVTEVRVQRLQEVSEEDARAEGVAPVIHEEWTAYDPETEGYPSFSVEPDAETIACRRLENIRHHGPKVISTAKEQFRLLWLSINGLESWDANPWTWAISFRVLP